ncbi:MAG: hypothetical protein Q9214_003719 [Letrouitia sp. 1 TL-2023]
MSKGDFGGYKRIMQYFWDPEPRNEDPSGAEIWCLGRHYTLSYPTAKGSDLASVQVPNGQGSVASGRTSNFIDVDHENSHTKNTEEPDYAAVQESVAEESGGWPTEFLDDFESRFWFTYRSNFPPIPRLSFDLFGCPFAKPISPPRGFHIGHRVGLYDTLRAESARKRSSNVTFRTRHKILFNLLISLANDGADWRRGQQQLEERQLLTLFADDPEAPFSIHRFVEHGASACGKHPGEWFGPSATARCIQ